MRKSLIRSWLSAAATVAAVSAVVWGLYHHSQDDDPLRISASPGAVTGEDAIFQNADWTVNPRDAGSQLPPAGRSLFDHLVTASRNGVKVYDVPFPFTALIEKIEERLQGSEQNRSPLKKVLIPLGRSLQRSAAAPEYFTFPRAVVAVDGDPAEAPGQAGMLMKDRLYLGYQEKADLIEVISYNEAAGRFEFQVVKNYRRGAKPEVLYANRVLCVSCHRNQSPIFSRQTWDETNAAAEVRLLLKTRKKSFYGFPIDQGVDIPNAIDDATDRANLFAASQLLWREGCEGRASAADAVRCRALIFKFMLQFRLSGGRFFDAASKPYTEEFVPAFARRWRELWPRGLVVPDPDIPNRTLSLHGVAASRDSTAPEVAEQADVTDSFDPLNPRAPLAIWKVTEDDTREIDRVILGIAEFVTAADVRRLDHHIFATAQRSSAQRRTYEISCEFERAAQKERSRDGRSRVKFRCQEKEFDLAGRLFFSNAKLLSASIDHVKIAGAPVLEDWDAAPALEKISDQWTVTVSLRPRRDGLHPRHPDGSAVETLKLVWRGDSSRQPTFMGRAQISLLLDFEPLHAAIERMAQKTIEGKSDVFSAKPFRRAVNMKALHEELRMPPLKWCCVPDAPMPAPRLDAPQASIPTGADKNGAAANATAMKFHRQCAICHGMAEASPANFLYGDESQVPGKLAHCAERIFFRLAMDGLPAHERPKSPMPPVAGLDRKQKPARRQAELADLKQWAAKQLEQESGKAPRIEDLMARGYWNLRSCLPPKETQTAESRTEFLSQQAN